ncbi:MAG: DUF1963 domain-containing protein [Muribaculaceae bacterium]
MALRIIPDDRIDNNLPVTSSYWWGDPDMIVDDEDSFEWPHTADGTDLIFIGQINLADIPFETPLPYEGLLLFFADIDYFLGNYDADPCGGIGLWPKGACRVIYYPKEQFNEIMRVHFVINNQPCTPRARRIDIDVCESRDYGIKLFGRPACFEWFDWPDPCEGWKLLLQVDTEELPDHTLRFYDDGLLYFIIDPDDLRHARFDRVRAFLYTT